MDNDLFKQLETSLKQASKIAKGQRNPSRAFVYGAEGVCALRELVNLSQEKFATLLGISVGTLRNWEQGRRTPQGPALALLRAIKNDPENVIKALRR